MKRNSFFNMLTLIYLLLVSSVSGNIQSTDNAVVKKADLPTFLKSLTNLRNKLIDLLGPFNSEDKDNGSGVICPQVKMATHYV